MSHNAAAVAAKTYRQHAPVRNTQQVGIKSGMGDERHQPILHSPVHVRQRFFHIDRVPQCRVDLGGAFTQVQAADLVRKLLAVVVVPAHALVHLKTGAGFFDEGSQQVVWEHNASHWLDGFMGWNDHHLVVARAK